MNIHVTVHSDILVTDNSEVNKDFTLPVLRTYSKVCITKLVERESKACEVFRTYRGKLWLDKIFKKLRLLLLFNLVMLL